MASHTSYATCPSCQGSARNYDHIQGRRCPDCLGDGRVFFPTQVQAGLEDFAWVLSTEERYNEQHLIVEPVDALHDPQIRGNAFLMGEAMDHNGPGTGFLSDAKRYLVYRRTDGEYFMGSRPITVDEFQKVRW